jgi:tetratricopeptide (TPR) repeat protein
LDVGRVEECVRYSDAGRVAFLGGRETVPPGFEAWLGTMTMKIGQPERSIEWCNRLLARGADPYGLAGCGLVLGLMRAGSHADAMAVANDLVDRAEHIPNPYARSFALLIYGIALSDADPFRARDALRRGLGIAQDSGIRYNESHFANILGRLEARSGDPLTALGYLTSAIRNYHDSGKTTVIRIPLAVLAVLLHRLGRDDPAATVAGYARSAVTRGWLPELGVAISQLREDLGDQTYETLASRGKSMTISAIAAYAYDQIDQVRAELEQLR